MLDTTLHKKDYIAYIYNTDALIQVGNVSFPQPSLQMRNFKLQQKQCVIVNLTFLEPYKANVNFDFLIWFKRDLLSNSRVPST